MLGHDNPDFEVPFEFLKQSGLWIHAKNLEALYVLGADNSLNFFWHQQDDFTLTSKGYIWTFPGKSVCNKSVIVDKDRDWKYKGYKCHGVCTDWVF